MSPADPLERLRAALADRYAIERELGSGGMATVYLAEDRKHHRHVAVKVLRPELAAALGVHQLVLGRLFTSLAEYLAPRQAVAQTFFAPGDVIWSDEEYVQPDLFVVPANEVTGDWRDCRTLLLAVEVVSPGSARADRLTKRRLYQRRGVGAYWVVDPNARLAEAWHPDDERPEIVADVLRWRVTPDAEEWQVDLRELFRGLPA